MPGTAFGIYGRVAAGLATAAMLAVSTPAAMARRSSVIDNLVGSWSGAGVVTSSSGQSERIRCNVSYEGGSEGLNQNLVCASASFRFNVTASLVTQGNSVSGTWQETTRGVGGNVSGSVRGNQIVTNVVGNNFTASLVIVSRGNSQSVTIQPSAGDISRVSISFRRSG